MPATRLTRWFLHYCRGPGHPAKYRVIAALGRWLFPRTGFVADLAEGFALHLQVFDHLERCLVLRGDYEPLTSRFVRANVPPAGVTAVAGANLGYYPLLMAHAMQGRGRVIALEPYVASFDRGARNLALNPALAPSITLVAAALGAETGFARIAPPPVDNSGAAHLGSTGPDGVVVSVQRLDLIMAHFGVERPDLMVLDVEGGESEAIAGFGAARPSVLVFESDPRHQAARGRTEAQLFAQLRSLGYELARLDGRPAQPGEFRPEQSVVAFQAAATPRWLPPVP